MTPPVHRESVIPMGAWFVASFLALGVFLCLGIVFSRAMVPIAFQVLLPGVAAATIAGYTILVGYIYGDARRRGMRYVMWTLLAIFVPNGIGIILYFLLRDPYPAYCARCGGVMQSNHVYCPHCGAGVSSACGACRRPTQPGWTNCPWCGAKLQA